MSETSELKSIAVGCMSLIALLVVLGVLLATCSLMRAFDEPAGSNTAVAHAPVTDQSSTTISRSQKLRLEDTPGNDGIGDADDHKSSEVSLAVALGLDGMKSLRSSMGDPAAAKFSDVWAGKVMVEGKPAIFACGTINAQNGVGGYSGPMKFIAFGSMVTTEQDAGFSRIYTDTCAVGEKITQIEP